MLQQTARRTQHSRKVGAAPNLRFPLDWGFLACDQFVYARVVAANGGTSIHAGGGSGALVLIVWLGGFVIACNDSKEFEELRTREQALQIKLAAELRERVDADRKRQQAKADAEKRQHHGRAVAKLAELKPWDRAAQLATCARGETKCPENQGPDVFLEAATNDGERARLNEVWRLNRRAQEANAPAENLEGRSVKCCDGTRSPSCTCGGPVRDCCSRHRGVCGCE